MPQPHSIPSPRPLPAPLDNAANSTGRGNQMSSPRPNQSLAPSPPPIAQRSSYSENVRSYPPSPRAQRNPSFSGQALKDLIMNPPVKANGEDSNFKGRDWATVQVHEIIDPAETRFVELDTSIEETTKLLIKSGSPNVVLIRESRKTRTAIGTFGYDDLNAYLLLVLGMSSPDAQAARLAERARAGNTIPLCDIRGHLGPTDEPAFLPHTADLSRAMELLGSGCHRIVLCKEGTSEAVGVLTQLRLVRFFWENHQSFAVTEHMYGRTLKDLELGEKEVVAINGDRPLSDALQLMYSEGITSLPVLDSHRNVIGNISHVDVRLLTDTSAMPLLSSSCIHFVSVILSERGMMDGKDAYPVFHVTPFSTMAQTVAKLVATRSHRMWLVDASSPSQTMPPSPGTHHVSAPFSIQNSNSHAPNPTGRHVGGHEMTPGPPYTSTHPSISVSAGQLPGDGMSGRLSGVVSLTDVLNVLARTSGLSPGDPEETMRRRRRRSSSSSTRPSVRASSELARGSGDLSRSTSMSSRR